MIRSSSHSINQMNNDKKSRYHMFLSEYRRVGGLIVDSIWKNGYSYVNNRNEICEFNISKYKLDMPIYLDYNAFDIETILSGRALSSLVTQLSGIIRSVTDKQRKRLYMYDKCCIDGEYNESLWTKIESTHIAKPNTTKLNPELSSKCVDWCSTNKEFDGFLRMKSLGSAFKDIKIPIKFHKHSNKFNNWNMKHSFLFSDQSINIRWEKENVLKSEGRIVGADQGKLTTMTFSDGQVTKADKHNHDLTSIIDKLSRKRKGSNAFKKASDHRTNYINWSINQLNLDGIKEIRMEEVININYGKRVSRQMQHWTNTIIRDKMERIAEISEVRLIMQSSTYRSQRCSSCSIVRKANRKGKLYECNSCGLIMDADLNAANNHEINLPDIPKYLQVSKLNRSGFLWKSDGFFNFDGVELRVPLNKK